MRARKANQFIPRSHRQGRILDIGCGYYPYFLINTEFSERHRFDRLNRDNGDKIMRRHGVHLHSFDIEKDGPFFFEDEYFDVVTMLAVLEHIHPDKLKHVLREIHRILKPGGRYILTTPVVWTEPLLRLMARLNLVSHEELDEHKITYTPRSIALMLEEGGFERRNIRVGTFEAFMNVYAVATK